MGGNCKGCTGSHGTGGCGCKAPPEPRIGEELPRLPYETLYERCQCGRLGLSSALWDEFGPSITTANWLHFRKKTKADCLPREKMPPGDQYLSDKLRL